MLSLIIFSSIAHILSATALLNTYIFIYLKSESLYNIFTVEERIL